MCARRESALVAAHHFGHLVRAKRFSHLAGTPRFTEKGVNILALRSAQLFPLENYDEEVQTALES
jgi:hypothetical protein